MKVFPALWLCTLLIFPSLGTSSTVGAHEGGTQDDLRGNEGTAPTPTNLRKPLGAIIQSDDTGVIAESEEVQKEFLSLKEHALSIQNVSMSEATTEESLDMMKELSVSFATVDKLLTRMQDKESGHDEPWVRDLKIQVLAALPKLAEFISVVETAGLDTNTTLATKHRQLERKHKVAEVILDTTGRGTDAGSDSEKQEEKQHWHGFETHRHYRKWKNERIKQHPGTRRSFEAHEHLNTANYASLHAKLLQRSHHLSSRIRSSQASSASHGRRLSETELLEEQCQLLVGCASRMSTYDLVFYHFSDYIDTTTGKFADTFRTPLGFDLADLQDDIEHAIAAVEADMNLASCNSLLSVLHQNEPIEGEDYFAWLPGAVSEVCHAAGTTEKIDLYLIGKHIGVKAAVRIVIETITAAEALYEKRDLSLFQDETFPFKDASGVRFPVVMKGPDVLNSERRPDPNIKLEKFYEYASLHVQDYEDLYDVYTGDDSCPNGNLNGGVGEGGDLQCGAPPGGSWTSSKPWCSRFLVMSYYKSFDGKNEIVGVNGAFSAEADAKMYYWDWHHVYGSADLKNGLGSSWREVVFGNVWSRAVVEVIGTTVRVVRHELGYHGTGSHEPMVHDEGRVLDQIKKAAKNFGAQLRGARKGWLLVVRSELHKPVDKPIPGPPNPDGTQSALVSRIVPEKYWDIKSYLFYDTKTMNEFTKNAAFVGALTTSTFEMKGGKAVLAGSNYGYNWELARHVATSCSVSFPLPNPAQVFANDQYAGWYDVGGCGQCNVYCRWKGGSDPGGNPSWSTAVEGSSWTCLSQNGRNFREEVWAEDKAFPFARCHAFEAPLNSTRLVFGTASPGQMRALAKATTEVFTEDEACIPPWQKRPDSATFGYQCDVKISEDDSCNEDCRKLQCTETGGVWSSRHSRCSRGVRCPESLGWRGVIQPDGRRGCQTVQQMGFSALSPTSKCTALGGKMEEELCILTPAQITTTKEPEIPGICCLDDSSASGVWGEPFDCSDKCSYHAPSLSGLNSESCDIYGGTWCPKSTTNCAALVRCVARYLKAAKDESSEEHNPTFAEYLFDSPNVTDAWDTFQCGQVREYFGFEALMTNDVQICREIKEARFSRNLDFMNDVVKDMPPGAPVELPGQSSAMGGSVRAGGGLEGIVDPLEDFQISTEKLVVLAAPTRPTGVCNGKLKAVVFSTLFGLKTIYAAVVDIWNALAGFECPEDPTGFVKTTCAFGKNVSLLIAGIIKVLFSVVAGIAQHVTDKICGFIDPYTSKKAGMEIETTFKNLGTAYGLLSARQQQTHDSLNSMNAQMPKISASLANMARTSVKNITAVMEELYFEKEPGVQGSKLDEILSRLPEPQTGARNLLEVGSTKYSESLLEELKQDMMAQQEELKQDMMELKSQMAADMKAQKAHAAAQKEEMQQHLREELQALKDEMMAEFGALVRAALLSKNAAD